MRDTVTESERPPTRRTLAKVETRQKVLAKARELFRARGYTGTTIRDIAAEIGMSIGAVFSNYLSKGDIFRDVINGEYDDYRRALDAVPADAAVLEKIVEVFAIDYMPERLALLRIEMELSWSIEGASVSGMRVDYLRALMDDALPPWHSDVIDRLFFHVWSMHLELCRTQGKNQKECLTQVVRRALRHVT